METDPNIKVEITDDTIEHCFRLTIGETTFLVHAKSLHSLIALSTEALLKWNAKAGMELIEVLEAHKP